MADDTLQILIAFRTQLDGLTKSIDGLRTLKAEGASAGGEIKSSFGGLFASFTAAGLATTAITSIVGSTLELLKSSISEANQSFENSRNLEMTVEGYQKLRAVIRLNGGDVAAMDSAIEHLNRSLVDARDSTTGAASALRLLKLDPAELQGQTMEQRFITLSRAIDESKDSAEAWRAAGMLLGERTIPRLRDGLNALAKEGFAGLSDMADEAEADGIRAIHAFSDSWEKNIAILKSKIVTDVGSLLSGLGYGPNGKEIDPSASSRADTSKLSTLLRQREAVDRLKLALGNLSEVTNVMTNDPSFTDSQKKFWVNSAVAQAEKLIYALRQIRAAMPLDVLHGETQQKRDAELEGYYLKIKGLGQSVKPGASAYAQSKDRFENYNSPQNGIGGGNAGFLSPEQGLKAGAMDWVSGLGSTGEQAAAALKATLGATVTGISDGIYGWITGAKTFGQAMASLGGTVLKSILDAIIKIGVQMVINAALRMTLNQKEAESEKSSLGVLAVKAGLKALSQLGPIYGTIAFIAALAGIYALTKGFSEGGYTGDVGTREVAGVVHGQEYVINAAATNRLGTGFLDSLNAGAPISVAGSPVAFDGAGAGAASGGRESGRNVHIYLDKSAWLDSVQEDLSGIAHAVYDKRERS